MRKQQYVSGMVAMTMAALLGTVVTVRGGTFDPTDISGLSMWLDASAIDASDGDYIHRWEDSSANDVDMGTFYSRYGNSELRSPTYETNELNGKSVLRFNQGVDADDRDLMSTGTAWGSNMNALNLSQDATLITVYAGRSAGNDNAVWAFSSGQVQYHNSIIRSQVSPYPTWISDVAVEVDAYNVDTLTLQGKDTTSQYYRDGALYQTGTVGTTASSQDGDLGDLVLAAKHSLSAYKDVDYAEIIAVDRAINSAERNAVDFYLEMKYGLASSATGAMLTETTTANTIISSGTLDTFQTELDITDTDRGSLAMDLAALSDALAVNSSGNLTLALDFEDTDGTLDTAALLSWLDGLSNDDQFYTVSYAPSKFSTFDLAVTFSGPSSSTAYFNWDTGDSTIQLSRVMAIPEPASGLLLALAGLMLGRRRFGK